MSIQFNKYPSDIFMPCIFCEWSSQSQNLAEYLESTHFNKK